MIHEIFYSSREIREGKGVYGIMSVARKSFLV
jgi:hypothetical protein